MFLFSKSIGPPKRSGLLQDGDAYQTAWPHCFIAANLPPRGPSFPEGCKRNTDVCVNVSHQGELPDQCQRNGFLKENKEMATA